ncbi:MAG TPA: RHS repeat-associated core domain-containing protein, partial [Candidatus Binatia bacterium]|nr:RHS repeat-associated core domain-containing protein [Candidatus Binatia bacterium]
MKNLKRSGVLLAWLCVLSNCLTTASLPSCAYTGGQTNAITRSYAYDNLYRLTGEAISVNSQQSSLSYSYDPVGNRLIRASTLAGLGNQSFSYDANDQLTSDTCDSNGNTLTSPASGPTVPDVYDHANRLIARHLPLGVASFQYDGDGNRVGKQVNGVTTHFLVDEVNPTGWPQVLEEQTWDPAHPPFTTPAATRVYTYGYGPLSQDQLTGNTWTATHFGRDGHGNVRYLSDAAGHATDTFDYDAFGSLIAHSGATPATRLFSGEEFDSDLGLYNLRARYHNPATGRFWTRDSFEGFSSDPRSLHAYGYAYSDPVNRSDPSGHYTFGEAMAVSASSAQLQPMLDQLWRGINYYTHGLGGGSALKAVNGTEGLFIQSLSQHVGINLGQKEFFAAMQGAPFLLAANPFVYSLNNDCFHYQVLGFDSQVPVYGCANLNPVFTFNYSNDPMFQFAEGLVDARGAARGVGRGARDTFELGKIVLGAAAYGVASQ